MDRFDRNVVWYRANVDLPDNKPLLKSYHVTGIPTTVVLDTKGAEVDRIIGLNGRSEWLKTLLGYLYGVDTLQDYLDRAGTAPTVAEGVTIAQKYLDRGEPKESLVWVDKARALKPGPDGKATQTLRFIEAQAWLTTDAPKGIEALTVVATDAKDPNAAEAFSTLSGHYRREVKNAKDVAAKRKAEDSLMALYHKLLPAHQDDAQFLNDYAWHCAELGVELDQALTAGQRAAELGKQDPGILDTVAEVYYKMGKSDQAVGTIDRALKQKPGDSYLEGQRAKFLKAGGSKDKH